MPSLTSSAVVAVVALVAPLAVRLTRVPLSDIVLQIVLGILIGPQVLGWADADAAVQVLALIGLAFLLLLSGLEIDFDGIRGNVLRVTATGFALSCVLAVGIGIVLGAADLVRSPLLIAVVLSATSLGIILPVLKEAGQLDTVRGGHGRWRVDRRGGPHRAAVTLVHRGSLRSAVTVDAARRIPGPHGDDRFAHLRDRTVRVGLANFLLALQDTTAEIRVRGAVALLMVLSALATTFGVEAILGAFLAGATIKLLDRNQSMTHTLFHLKLQAVGFGAFVPFFFVSTGMALDVRGLFDEPTTLAKVPVFLAALVVVRAVPALCYASVARRRTQLLAAGLLQATSLSIPIVAGSIGVDLGLIRPENYTALVAAGLVSVVMFPLLAVPWLADDHP